MKDSKPVLIHAFSLPPNFHEEPKGEPSPDFILSVNNAVSSFLQGEINGFLLNHPKYMFVNFQVVTHEDTPPLFIASFKEKVT